MRLFKILFVLICVIPITLCAQDNPCEQSILESTDLDDPLRYCFRETRCEGRFVGKSSSYMQILSLTQSFEKHRFETINQLVIEWNTPLNHEVKIRAFGLNPDLNFRMDASVDSTIKKYHWPVNVLRSLMIMPDEIGVVAWMNMKVSGKVRPVFLPLRIGRGSLKILVKSYEVIFKPSSELNTVSISLAKVERNGNISKYLLEGKPLEAGFFPALQPIKFETPKIEEKGLYYLEITAVQVNGIASDPIQLWFYHSNF